MVMSNRDVAKGKYQEAADRLANARNLIAEAHALHKEGDVVPFVRNIGDCQLRLMVFADCVCGV